MRQILGRNSAARVGNVHNDVRVVRLPRHGASCPIGLGVSCSADRNIKCKINKDGIWIERMDNNPGSLIPEELRNAEALVTSIERLPFASIIRLPPWSWNSSTYGSIRPAVVGPILGMEAIWKIEVENFPAFILVDDKGNDFFKQLKPCEGCTILD